MGIAFFILVAKLNHVIEYAFIGLLVFWIGIKIKNMDFHIVKTPLDKPITIFVSWILVTIPFAVNPSYSFAEWRKTVLQFIFFFFVVNVVTKERQVRLILGAFFLGLVIVSFVGIIEHIVDEQSFWDKSSHAASLTSAGQWFSTYIVMGIPFTWFYFFNCHRVTMKFLLMISFALLLLALFLSHTRGAWLALGIQVMVFMVIQIKLKWLRLGLAGAVVGFLVVFFLWILFSSNKSLEEMPFASVESMHIRLDTWKIALEQIRENPIIGYGYGFNTFPMVNPSIQVGSGNTPSIDMHIHNVFLSKAYEVGLVGLVSLLAIISVIAKLAFNGFQKSPCPLTAHYGLCVLLLLVGILTRNLFDNMFAGTLAYLFWLLVGLYVALRLNVQHAENGTTPSPG